MWQVSTVIKVKKKKEKKVTLPTSPKIALGKVEA